jgi:hypothetical protein
MIIATLCEYYARNDKCNFVPHNDIRSGNFGTKPINKLRGNDKEKISERQEKIQCEIPAF